MFCNSCFLRIINTWPLGNHPNLLSLLLHNSRLSFYRLLWLYVRIQTLSSHVFMSKWLEGKKWYNLRLPVEPQSPGQVQLPDMMRSAKHSRLSVLVLAIQIFMVKALLTMEEGHHFCRIICTRSLSGEFLNFNQNLFMLMCAPTIA